MPNTGLVIWRPEYSLGMPRIDDQHQKLIAIIRSFQEAMLEARARSALGEILRKLQIYAQVHFALEERLMEEYAYPETAGHKAAHVRLTEQIDAFQARLDSHTAIPSPEVMIFMRNWLTSHILEVDKKLGLYLRGRGVE